MKRYRDAAGRLTMTTDQLAAATLDEANAYYQDGGRYICHSSRFPGFCFSPACVNICF